jgi:hypothetical protein
MNKENEFNLNLSYNSNEKVPIISISNKSKSNSSNNPPSQKFPKKFPRKLKNYDEEQNSSSFSIRHRMKKNSGNKTESSFSMYTFTQNSLILKNEKSKDLMENFGQNKSLTDKKGKKINSGNETPQKKSDKKFILIETFRNKKKDVLNVDNIHGKNLMVYFEKMSEKIDKEEKNKNRVPSVGNKLKNSFKLKNPVVNTNKSWNKNKFGFLLSKMPLKINNKTKKFNDNNLPIFPLKKKNRPMSRYNTSNIKNLQNLLNQNNINIDLKNLIEKYRPNKISKKEKNTNSSTEKTNSAKKLLFQKIQKTPNSDTHQRKISFSHLKMRETIMKNNLFQDYNKKHNEIINVNKLINTNERKPNDKIFEKNMIFHPQMKNKNSEIFAPLNKNNKIINTNKKKQSENKNNIQKINDYYLKYKEKMEIGKNKKSGH